MAGRTTDPIRFQFSGDKLKAKSLIPLGRKFLEIMGEIKKEAWTRRLADGTVLQMNTAVVPPIVHIHVPVPVGVPPPPEREQEFEHFLCTPTVFDPNTGDFVVWGAPFADNGTPINPPMGTVNGSHPEVVIEKRQTGFRALHGRNAEGGNIDWVWNRPQRQPRYLSWKGPYGRGVGLGRHHPNSDPGDDFLSLDYVTNTATLPDVGVTNTHPLVWYTRWQREIYLDGSLLVRVPSGHEVFSAAIANFDNVNYLIALCCQGTFPLGEGRRMINDRVLVAPIGSIANGATSEWNDLGAITWPDFILERENPRDLPHFFDPTGKFAIQTAHYFDIYPPPPSVQSPHGYVTTRIHVTSPTTYETSHEVEAYRTITNGLDDAAIFWKIHSDYDQDTGAEKYLQWKVQHTSGVFSYTFKWSSGLEWSIEGPSSSTSVCAPLGPIIEEGQPGYIESESGSSTDFDPIALVVDARYEAFAYYLRFAERNTTTQVVTVPEEGTVGFVYDRGSDSEWTQTLYFNTQSLLSYSGAATSSSQSFSWLSCNPNPDPPGPPITSRVGTQDLFSPSLPTGGISLPSPHDNMDARVPLVGFIANRSRQCLLSVWLVIHEWDDGDLNNGYLRFDFNHIGDMITLNRTELSILTALISQPQYNIERIPYHKDCSVF